MCANGKFCAEVKSNTASDSADLEVDSLDFSDSA